LERKARFFAALPQKMRPNLKQSPDTIMPIHYAEAPFAHTSGGSGVSRTFGKKYVQFYQNCDTIFFYYWYKVIFEVKSDQERFPDYPFL
jgi:hypothetical protein